MVSSACAGAGHQAAVGREDLALAAVRDAAQLDPDLVGGDQRHAVLARADRDHQVGLDVFQRLRVAAAGDPGGRHDEHLGAALDQRAADGRDAAVGADEDAQPAERRVDRFEREARPEPAAVEVPQEALVGPARDAVGGDDVGAVGQTAARCCARRRTRSWRRSGLRRAITSRAAASKSCGSTGSVPITYPGTVPSGTTISRAPCSAAAAIWASSAGHRSANAARSCARGCTAATGVGRTLI